jgi:hypothetical protein
MQRTRRSLDVREDRSHSEGHALQNSRQHETVPKGRLNLAQHEVRGEIDRILQSRQGRPNLDQDEVPGDIDHILQSRQGRLNLAQDASPGWTSAVAARRQVEVERC